MSRRAGQQRRPLSTMDMNTSSSSSSSLKYGGKRKATAEPKEEAFGVSHKKTKLSSKGGFGFGGHYSAQGPSKVNLKKRESSRVTRSQVITRYVCLCISRYLYLFLSVSGWVEVERDNNLEKALSCVWYVCIYIYVRMFIQRELSVYLSLFLSLSYIHTYICIHIYIWSLSIHVPLHHIYIQIVQCHVQDLLSWWLPLLNTHQNTTILYEYKQTLD